MKRFPRFTLWSLVILTLLLLLSACGETYQTNPLGVDYVAKNYQTNPGHPIDVPVSTGKPIPHLRPVGLGTTPATWAARYGKPLGFSQAPTQYAFKATIDSFPDGSVLIVSFDRGVVDNEPRAVQISYVAGDKHPTTIAQAQAIAEGFFPDDTTKPSQNTALDTGKHTCQSSSSTSPTLSQVFPAEDFLDKAGKLAQTGSVTISFFPHYSRSSYDHYENTNDEPDTNTVGSILITLGTKPYC